MGLFDFLKKKKVMGPKKTNIHELYAIEPSSFIEKQQLILNDETKPLDERNAAYLAIRDEEERRLNEAYDFNSIEGINSIPVPCREVNGGSATGRVEYYLRGKCAADHFKPGRSELGLACLRKAQELMYVSDMIWKKDDFMRLVRYLREAGKDQEADEEEKRVNNFFQKQNYAKEKMIRVFESAKYLNTDLIEIYNSGICCSECAKYRNRIYSISGKDRRFPALPKMFIPNTFSYNHVCLSFSPFVEDVHEPTFPAKDKKQLIKYSNRSFSDDRTDEEKRGYNEWKAMMDYMEKGEIKHSKNWKEYQWLQINLPNLCPKSISGYTRMKNANSKRYRELVKKAESAGFVFPKSIDEVWNWPINK